jgi:dienelactone hydrolase
MAVTGNLYPFLLQQAQANTPTLSFLNECFTEVEAWRAETREYLRSLMLFAPEMSELEPELVDHVDYPEYAQQKWYFTSLPGERIPVILLLPRGSREPAPAIVALHDHSGMYYFGKKKLLDEENEPALLTDFQQTYYDGVGIASALARRGYVVAVIDSFYFGERRLTVPPPADMQEEFLLAAEGSEQWISLLNRISARMEDVVAKSLYWAGMTWPGILAWDDMRTVDFLLTRPEVDGERLGCVGLSMGGMRAALLGALDPRVNAVCVAGWMSTLGEMLEEHVALHSWVNFIPGLTQVLDWPDVAALHAPDPLLVVQGSQDPFFPLDGFQKAAERLRTIYAKAGAPGKLDIGLFDSGHAFTADMQQLAWEFFDSAFGTTRHSADPAASC